MRNSAMDYGHAIAIPLTKFKEQMASPTNGDHMSPDMIDLCTPASSSDVSDHHSR